MNIQEIADMAKEQLLEMKEYPPTFFVEFKDKGIGMVIMTWLEESTQKKAIQFVLAARQAAKENHWNASNITAICFAVEAWVSKQRRPGGMRPSEDPNRIEALTVMHLQVPSMKITVQNIEMLRDGSGDLVDLLCRPEVNEAKSSLLPSFLAGIASTKYSDAQLNTLFQGGKL